MIQNFFSWCQVEAASSIGKSRWVRLLEGAKIETNVSIAGAPGKIIASFTTDFFTRIVNFVDSSIAKA